MQNPATSQPDNGKTVAILSYITLIGWIIALVMHGNNKTSLGAFHLRQTLGIILTAIVIAVVRFLLHFIPFAGWALGLALSISLFVLWIIGLVSAINGEEKPIPLVGERFQVWFASFGK